MVVKISSGRGFGGAVRYVTHDRVTPGARPPETSERVVWSETRHLCRDPALGAAMMAATAASADAIKRLAGVGLGGRRVTDPLWHIVISWSKDERPHIDDQREAVDSFLKAIGCADRQAVVAVHDDTEYTHVHIILNRVSPTTGRAARMTPGFQEAHDWALKYERDRDRLDCPARLARKEALERGEAPPPPKHRSVDRDRSTGAAVDRHPDESWVWSQVYEYAREECLTVEESRALRRAVAADLDEVRPLLGAELGPPLTPEITRPGRWPLEECRARVRDEEAAQEAERVSAENAERRRAEEREREQWAREREQWAREREQWARERELEEEDARAKARETTTREDAPPRAAAGRATDPPRPAPAATLPRSSGPTPAPDDELYRDPIYPDQGGDDGRGPGGASPDPVPKHTPARNR